MLNKIFGGKTDMVTITKAQLYRLESVESNLENMRAALAAELAKLEEAGRAVCRHADLSMLQSRLEDKVVRDHADKEYQNALDLERVVRSLRMI